MYRHVLPPGFVLKKVMEESDSAFYEIQTISRFPLPFAG